MSKYLPTRRSLLASLFAAPFLGLFGKKQEKSKLGDYPSCVSGDTLLLKDDYWVPVKDIQFQSASGHLAKIQSGKIDPASMPIWGKQGEWVMLPGAGNLGEAEDARYFCEKLLRGINTDKQADLMKEDAMVIYRLRRPNRHIFYIDIPEEEGEKFLERLKEQFAKKRKHKKAAISYETKTGHKIQLLECPFGHGAVEPKNMYCCITCGWDAWV